MTNAPTVEQVQRAACRLSFSNRVIQNNLRSIISEVIVGCALNGRWENCSGDWKGWDFEHELGMRLEVKQSAALQTWIVPPAAVVHKAIFDIRARSGYYDGSVWVDQVGRNSQIYVFCLHDRTDGEADHRDARQWQFFVAKACCLPSKQKSISINRLRSIAIACEWRDLCATVEVLRMQIESGGVCIDSDHRTRCTARLIL